MQRTVVRAFTLVELLVVVALIAGLVALVMTVYWHSRERARRTVCASNLRQLVQAFRMYAEDSDGYFPPYRNHRVAHLNEENRSIPEVPGCYNLCGNELPFAPDKLVDVVNPYIRDREIWFCPSDQFQRTSTNYWCVFHRYSSYHFNLRLHLLTIDGLQRPDAAAAPSGWTLIADPENPLKNDPPHGLSPAPEEIAINPPGGHHGGVNLAKLDGHVEWVNYPYP